MNWRERIIQYQNEAEAAFAEEKSVRTTFHFIAAFITFMMSTFVAGLRLPFVLIRKQFTTSESAASGAILHLNSNNIDAVFRDHSLIVLDFWAEWCGPCLMMNPLLEEFAQAHPEVCVAKVDGDANPNLLQQFHIKGLPQFVLIKDQMEIRRHAGPMTSVQLKEFVKC